MKKILVLITCLMLVLPGCTQTAPTTETSAPPTEPMVPQITDPVTIPTTEVVTEQTTEAVTEPPLDFTELDHDAIYAEIERISQQYGAMGVQVAIVENGEVVGSYAYGWATNKKVPMTTDHKIRVASITKVAIGIAAIMLHEDGTVDLQASIGDIWGVPAQNPQFPDHVINIWNILSHTSSIASYEDDVPTTYWKVRSKLAGYGYWSVEPGVMTSRCYNNYAFRVLGSTLELAAGKTMNDIMDEKLFDSMEIDAAFAPGDLDDTSLVATLYEGTLVTRTVAKQLRYHGPENPGDNGSYYAGGLTISAEDMAKLAAMLGNDGVYNGQRYMSNESVELIEQLMDTPMKNGAYQGHPLLHVPEMYGREKLYFHTGHACGVFTSFSYDAATGDGVVVLTTGARGYMNDLVICLICDDINAYMYDVLK